MPNIFEIGRRLVNLKKGSELLKHPDPNVAGAGEKIYENARESLARMGLTEDEIDILDATHTIDNPEEREKFLALLRDNRDSIPALEIFRQHYGSEAIEQLLKEEKKIKTKKIFGLE